MKDYPLPAGAYEYRPLKLLQVRMEGWDVYALQTGLNGTPGFGDLECDGIFGTQTKSAVQNFQEARGMEVDAIAGIATQTKLCQVLARQFRKNWDLPNGCPYGSIEAEVGGQIGNYSMLYPATPSIPSSRDMGIIQCNDYYNEMTTAECFNAPGSLQVFCRAITAKWKEYHDLGTVPNARAFALACGSWNRPAYTDALARGKTSVIVGGKTVDLTPGAPERVRIETYISRCTAYVDLEAL